MNLLAMWVMCCSWIRQIFASLWQNGMKSKFVCEWKIWGHNSPVVWLCACLAPDRVLCACKQCAEYVSDSSIAFRLTMNSGAQRLQSVVGSNVSSIFLLLSMPSCQLWHILLYVSSSSTYSIFNVVIVTTPYRTDATPLDGGTNHSHRRQKPTEYLLSTHYGE